MDIDKNTVQIIIMIALVYVIYRVYSCNTENFSAVQASKNASTQNPPTAPATNPEPIFRPSPMVPMVPMTTHSGMTAHSGATTSNYAPIHYDKKTVSDMSPEQKHDRTMKHINEAQKQVNSAVKTHPITAHPDTIAKPKEHNVMLVSGGIKATLDGHKLFELDPGILSLIVNSKNKNAKLEYNGSPLLLLSPNLKDESLTIKKLWTNDM